MGSVQSQDDECPRCKQEHCFSDYYYKTGEEILRCPDCGYYYSAFYKRDDDGKFVRTDESKGFEFDNLMWEEKIIDEPYGAYMVYVLKGGGQGGTLETKKDYDEFVGHIVSLTNQPNDIDYAYVSRLVNGEIVKEDLYKRS